MVDGGKVMDQFRARKKNQSEIYGMDGACGYGLIISVEDEYEEVLLVEHGLFEKGQLIAGQKITLDTEDVTTVMQGKFKYFQANCESDGQTHTYKD